MDIPDFTEHVEEEVTVATESEWTLTIYCALVLGVHFVIVWILKISSGRCRSNADLSGKVAIVTGANQGRTLFAPPHERNDLPGHYGVCAFVRLVSCLLVTTTK